MSATVTRLAVVAESQPHGRDRAPATDRLLALQVAIAVVLGVVLAAGLTWVVLATQTLQMSI